MQLARAVHSNLTDEYFDVEGVHSIMLEAISETVDGRHKIRPSVYVNPAANLTAAKDAVPEEIDGISIDVRAKEPPEPLSCNVDFGECTESELQGRTDHNQMYHHGGTAIYDENKDFTGTAGYPVQLEGGYYMRTLTATHIFNDDLNWCTTDELPAYAKPSSGSCDKICDSNQGSTIAGEDAIIMPSFLNDFPDTSHMIYTDNHSRRFISGHLTEDGVAYHHKNHSYEKFGTLTGKTSGLVEAWGECRTGATPCVGSTETIRLDSNTMYDFIGGGDSGAPVFREEDNSMWIAGHLFGGTDPQDDMCSGNQPLQNEWYVSAAYNIVDKTNYVVGAGNEWEP